MLPHPDELLPTSAYSTSDTHIYQSGQDHKEGSSMALYNSPKHKHGVPSSTDPYYSYVSTMSSNMSESSTTNIVPNPVYGLPSLPHNSDGIYTTPKPLASTEKKDTSTSEEYPYSYARVETSSRVSLKSSSNSVVRKDEPISQDPLPAYEYIKMAAAAPARPEVENGPTVTLNPDSGSEEQSNVVFTRSIYDDNFQYETVNIKKNSTPAQVSESDSHQLDPTKTQSSPYDIPRCTQSPEKPNELTTTCDNVSNQPPYDRLDRGTDFTQPMNFVRLGKIEGSGYEILNKSSQ